MMVAAAAKKNKKIGRIQHAKGTNDDDNDDDEGNDDR